MKRLGLIGGSGWPSTLEYYRLLNTYFGERHGSAHALDMVLRNLDFEIFRGHLNNGLCDDAVKMLVDGAHDCKKAGAQFLAFAANGLHRFLPEIEQAVGLPFVHIAKATAKSASQLNLNKVGLLGVRATMEGSFYPDALREYGMSVVVPIDDDKALIDQIIFSELVHGKFTQQSKEKYIAVMNRLADQGAEGVVLGCTEIPLLIQAQDFHLPLLTTTEIHCRAILDFAVS